MWGLIIPVLLGRGAAVGDCGSLAAGASSSWETLPDVQQSFLSCFGLGAHHKKDPGRSLSCSTPHAKASPIACPGHSPSLQQPRTPSRTAGAARGGQAETQIYRHRSS